MPLNRKVYKTEVVSLGVIVNIDECCSCQPLSPLWVRVKIGTSFCIRGVTVLAHVWIQTAALFTTWMVESIGFLPGDL